MEGLVSGTKELFLSCIEGSDGEMCVEMCPTA